MLGIVINNETLKAFLNPVNSIEPYKLSITKDQIEYEIEEDHIRQKTILLKNGCENYNVEDSVCLELPLKRIKDVLRRMITKKDSISITSESRDNQDMLVFNCNINYKIKYTELQQTGDSEQKNANAIVSEDENTTPKENNLKHNEPIVLSQGKYKCVKCKTFKHLVKGPEGFKHCLECLC